MRFDAPWSPAQVEALNRWQRDPHGLMHPFTCPGEGLGCGEDRALTATPQGWVCRCGRYTQTWCHDYMAGWEV